MKAMITAPQPLAVDAGATVLRAGGNAIDAAVTAAFVQMVVDPRACGVGGFGMMNIHTGGREIMLDFHGKAGQKVKPGMWENIVERENSSGYGYTLEGDVNLRGYQAITTPGTVAGLFKAQSEHGTLPWKDVIQSGIQVAQDGYEVSKAVARTRQAKPFGSESSPWISRGSSSYEDGGEFIANPDMAETFATISEGGAEVFYRGELAERIAQDIEREGGFVTLQDLNTYEVTENEPLVSAYREYTIASNQPPGGGATVIEMLNILDGFDLKSMGYLSAEYIYTVSKAMKAAWVDRANLLGDPAYSDIPLSKLLSREHAEHWRNRLDEPFSIPRWQPKEPESTTHLAVVDSSGMVVALTHSLGSGSDAITDGLGFMYNNCMNCFNPVPGHPNSIEPGKSRYTGMAPTLVKRDGKPYFSVGAPGGTRIVTGILHAILNVIDHGMSATEALAAPRFDCQSDVISAHARIPPSVCEQVKKLGHDINRKIASYGGIGNVHGIIIDPETGELDGGADPGGAGMALGV